MLFRSLIDEVGGTTYSLKYTTSGSCPNSSVQSVSVTALDDASFTLTNFCEGNANNANITGLAGGSFTFNTTPSDGSSVIAATGEIVDEVGGTTYTLKYTTSGVCPNSSTQPVTVTALDDASFELTDFCDGATNSANITGLTGGNFTFNVTPSDGSSINASTGEISDGVVGTTYSIEYTTSGSCPNSSIQSVSVTPIDDASFTLTDFCLGAANSAIITGLTGGGFAYNPNPLDGSSVNASTGEISNEIAGTNYSIEYSTSGSCPNSSIQSVSVTAVDDPSFNLSDFCVGAANSATSIATSGGTFKFEPEPGDGAAINPSTGEITNEVAGTTYSVEYVTGGACPDSLTKTVSVFALDDAGFTLSDFCEGDINSATITGLAGGSFTFNTTPSDGSSIVAATGEIVDEVGGATYTLKYTTSGTCPNSSTQSLTVTALDDASFSLTDFCIGDANNANITGLAGGSFTFNTTPTDGSSIIAGTGEITNEVAGASYSIKYTTSGNCPNTSIASVSVTPLDDASFTLTDFCIGDANGANITGLAGGNFTFNITPSDGSSVIAGTGEITNEVAGSTYSIKYTTAGSCPNSSIESVSVTALDNASFTLTDFCEESANSANITGLTGGSFSFNPDPSDGSSVIAATGEIVNEVGGTNYTIEYTTSGICPNTSLQSVSVTAKDDPTFAYSSTTFCTTGGDQTPVSIATGGGVFSEPTTLAINSSTGTVDVASSALGSYDITYTTTGSCPDNSTITVNITSAPSASFSYSATPYCQNSGSATVSFGAGSSGGVFSESTGDLVINSTTGAVNLNSSPPGSYTVNNDIAASSGCSAASASTPIEIVALDDAGFTLSDFCEGDVNSATITGLAGGSFTFNITPSDGSSLDASTGEIIDGVAGTTYTIKYTTSGSCANSSVKSVSVTSSDDPTFAYSSTTFCLTGGNQLPESVATAGGIFSEGTNSMIINSTTGEIDVASSGIGDYIITYNTSGSCAQSSNVTVSIISSTDGSFSYSETPYCQGSGTATITLDAGAIGGVFSESTGNLIINPATGEVDLDASASGTYVVSNEIGAIGGCAAVSVTTSIEIKSLDDASFALTDFCAGDDNAADVSGMSGGSFTFFENPSDGSSVNSSTGEISNGVGGTTYSIEYTTSGSCPNSSTETVTVNSLPTIGYLGNTSLCEGESTKLTAYGAASYQWGAGQTINPIIIAPSADTTIVVSGTIGSCVGNKTITVNVQALPIISISGDTTIFSGEEGWLSAEGGDSYSWWPSDGLSCVDCAEPEVFITESITYCVEANLGGCVDTACVNVEVEFKPEVECGEVYVPNAFSPNGDNNNDVLYVYGDCITELKFEIFNRWGESVFVTETVGAGWDGAFRGKNLNTGVFTYVASVVSTNQGEQVISGNVTLFR